VKDSIDLINSKPEPLVAYLFTNNQKLRNDFVQNVSCGGMVINDTVLHVCIYLFLKNHLYKMWTAKFCIMCSLR
jgi:acyl-CoA reductase-like NAD-dependent aldehyde dehydrogenase